MSDVTQLLSAIEQGDDHAIDRLLPIVYGELRRLAAQKLAQEDPGQTLQATALVHEAYLRLVGSNGQSSHWDNRKHFFAAAAEAMRRILVDLARHKATLKRGGDRRRIEFDQSACMATTPPDEILALHEALQLLEEHDPQGAELVKLRYFAGLTHTEAIKALDLSRNQGDRLWALAKAWLYERIAQ